MPTGTGTLAFGAAPGGSYLEVVVTGQTGILTSSHVEAFMQADTTADHNEVEHAIVPIQLRAGTIVAGVGFTVYASTEWRLTGDFTFHWVWI
jgi:hypothetical protein